jgi:hypothetical protein
MVSINGHKSLAPLKRVLELDVIDVIELDDVIIELTLVLFKDVSIVNPNVFGQFSVLLQISGFIGHVLEDNVRFLILQIAETETSN